jgi:diguanylate cyclase (GGDEF)-like protein
MNLTSFRPVSSLRMRLTLVVMLTGLVLFSAFALFAYSQARRGVQHGQARNLNELAVRVAVDLDARIALRQAVLANVALTMPEPVASDPLREQRLRLLRPVFDGIALYSAGGTVMAVAANAPFGLSLYGQRCLLDPAAHRAARLLTLPGTVVFCAPLMGREGAYRGMLVGTVDLDSPSMRHGLENLRDVGRGVSLLIYAQASRRQALHFGSDAAQPSALTQDRIMRHPAGDASAMVDGDDGALRVAYAPLETIGWVVAASQPVSESAVTLARMRRNLILAAALWLCLSPLLWQLMGCMLRPLHQLRRQLERYRPGATLHSPCREVQALAEQADRVVRVLHEKLEVLRARQGDFRNVSDGSPAAIFVVSADWTLDYLNPALLALLGGASEAGWLGRSWLELICNEDRIELARRRESHRGETCFVAPCRLTNDQRAYARVELTLLPFGPRTLGFALDVSEREALRAALRVERERGLAIASAVADAVIVTGPQGEIDYLNPAAASLLGVQAAQTLGRPLSAFAGFADPESGLPLSHAQLEALTGQGRTGLDLIGPNARLQAVVLTLDRADQGSGSGVQECRIHVLRDDSERRERLRASHWDVSHDPLTRLYNRHGFMSAFDTVLQGGDGCEHMLARLNLDHFGAVNERAGRHGGDRLLEQVAATVQSMIRRTDVAARLEGDDFAILLLYCADDWAEELLETLRRRIALLGQDVAAGEPGRITASIGLTRLREGEDAATALARADDRCHAAKRRGSNRLATSDRED